MKSYYLDNNVLVDIENGTLEISKFLSLRNSIYYFSPSHIEELIEGENTGKLSVDKRLKLIESLASCNCIWSGSTNPNFCKKTPLQLYQDEMNPLLVALRQYLNHYVSNIVFDREKFLKIIDMNSIEISNIHSNDILYWLNDILSKYMNITISDYLSFNNASGRTEFITLFNLLDLACYHKDRQTNHSDIARLHDASHAYYAQLCDVFVSNDKKMRYKTKAVYSYLGIRTSVLSIKELSPVFEK